MIIDESILREFVEESKLLIAQSLEILDEVESRPANLKKLEVYGNSVDRILGSARSLAVMTEPNHLLHFISDYCALCKAVGFKSSQIRGNNDFLMICLALLQDATEMLSEMLKKLTVESTFEKTVLNEIFLERLSWVSSQFEADVRESAKAADGDAVDLDSLLKKLGV